MSGSPRSARLCVRNSRAMASMNRPKPRSIDTMAAVPVSVASRAKAPPG
jgi:hypothetical protein